MSYHHDLLAQARLLVDYDPRRPKQANLRRAISAAYYGAFHLILDAAGREFVSGASREAERELLQRSIDHAAIKLVCESRRSWSPGALPPDLETVLVLLLQLQSARLKADYALREPVGPAAARAVIADAQDVFDAWERVRRDPAARAFLVALVARNRRR